MLAYKSIQTYQDLLDTNVRFLNGQIGVTPYCAGPIDEETKPMRDDLLRLHEFGFVSVCSQPAEKNPPRFIANKWIYNGRLCGNWWVETRQRSFLEGYLPTKWVDKWLAFMRSEPDYYYAWYTLEEAEHKQWLCFGKTITSLVPKLQQYTFPSVHDFALTLQKSHERKEQLDATPWDVYTTWSKWSMVFDFDGYPNLHRVLQEEDVVKIFIASKTFGEGACEKVLLKFFTIG